MKKILVFFMGILLAFAGRTQINLSVTNPYEQDFSGFTGGSMASPSASMPNANSLILTGIVTPVTTDYLYQANKVARVSSSTNNGKFKTQQIVCNTYDSIVVSFDAAPWIQSTTHYPAVIKITYGSNVKHVIIPGSTLISDEWTVGYPDVFTNYSVSFEAVSGEQIEFASAYGSQVNGVTYNSSNCDRRFFFDNLKIEGMSYNFAEFTPTPSSMSFCTGTTAAAILSLYNTSMPTIEIEDQNAPANQYVVALTWELDPSFDENIPATYFAKASFDLPAGLNNPGGYDTWFEMPFDINSALAPKLAIDFGDFIDDGENIPTYTMCKENEIIITLEDGVNPIWMYIMTDDPGMNGGFEGEMGLFSTRIDNLPSNFFSPTGIIGTYHYQLLKLEDANCTSLTTGTATQNEFFIDVKTVADPQPTTTFCYGDLLPTGDNSDPSNPITWVWKLGAAVVTNATVSGPYTVIATNGLGCTVSKSISLTVNPLPTVSVNLNAYSQNENDEYVMCKGAEIPIELIGAEPLELTLLVPNGITLPTTAGIHQIVAGQAGTFSFEFVSLIDGNGCSAVNPNANFDVLVNPLPTVSVDLSEYGFVSNHYVMCEGAEIPIELIGAEPLELTLLAPNGITLPTTAGIHQIVAGQAGTFSFEFSSLRDANGCYAINPNMDFDVLVNPLPTVSVDLSAYTQNENDEYVMCVGNEIPILLIGADPITLLLENSFGIPLPTTAGPHQIVAGQAGTFSFEFTSLTDANGCYAVNPNANFDVLVNPLPTVSVDLSEYNLIGTQYVMCEGNAIPIELIGAEPLELTLLAPNGITFPTTAGIHQIVAGQAGTFSFEFSSLTDGNGCSAINPNMDFDVLVKQSPTLSINFGAATIVPSAGVPVYNMCMGNPVSLTFGGQGNITMTMTTNDPDIEDFLATMTPIPAGTTLPDMGPTVNLELPVYHYNLISLTSDNGCSSDTTGTITPNTFNVVVYDNPAVPIVASFEPEDPICGSFQLPSSSEAGVTWNWYDESDALIINGIVTALGSADYYAKANSDYGCGTSVNSTSITVEILALLAAPTFTAESICFGESYTLDDEYSNYTLTWYEDNLGENEITVLNVSPTATTTYYAKYNDGCDSELGEFVLTVKPLPTVSVNLIGYSQNENDEYVMCEGAEIPLTLTGVAPITLELAEPNGITLPTTPGPHQIVAGQAGTFSFEFVSLTDGNGCYAVNPNANFDVLVNPLPTVSVDLSDYLVGAQYVMCEGNAIPLELIGAEPLELTLFAPNGITLPTTAGTHQIVAGQAGTFSFEFVSLTDGNGCSAINPNMDFDVLVKKSPTLSIGFGSVTISDDDGIPVYNMCMGNSVDLTFGGEVGSNVVLTIETNDPGMFPDGNGIVVMPAIPIITGGFTTIPDMGPTVDLDLPIYHYNLISLVSDNGCSSDTTGTATPNTFNVAVFDAPIQPLAIDLEPENGEAVCSSYTLLNDPEAGVTWTWTTMIESIETEVVEATLIGVNTYTLYATSIYNCGNKTVDISVEILEAPQTPTFTPDAICIGAEYSLVETYSSEDYALLWYSDNQGEEEITELTFTPSATATYYAKYSNGICISELGEFVLTVNPLPTSTPTYTTPQPACDSYTLPTAPSTTTDIWAWSDVSPVTATGDYTLIVTTTENCSATATLTVTITATPAAPTLTSITDETCQSELPYDLTAIFDGGTWTLINSEDTPDAVNIGGDYTVTTETNGCISSASTFTLTVNQADITIEREGNVLTATEGFDSYSWTFNGEPLLDENSEPITTNTITLLENGLYKVVVEDPITGCEGYDEMDVIGVSVKTIVTSNVSVYPNPSNGEFTIDLTSIEKANRYQIIDMKGAIVTESIITDNLQKVNINVVPGNYTVKVITDTKAYIETIIIK